MASNVGEKKDAGAVPMTTVIHIVDKSTVNATLCQMIFDVVNWFLAQSSKEAPITHLSLQKLLYFTQCWSIALLDEEFFDDDCQAWAHGAVYPKVYTLFKQFKYMPLPKVEKAPEFGNKNLKILDAVKKYYYDIYSAKALEEICHREKPYINAREGYEEGESCNIVIDKKNISS